MATYTPEEQREALKEVLGWLPLSIVEVDKKSVQSVQSVLHYALSEHVAFRKEPWADALKILWAMHRLAEDQPRARPDTADLREVKILVFGSLIVDVGNVDGGALQSVYGPTDRALCLAEELRAAAARAGRVDGALDAALRGARAKLDETVERSRGLRF